MNQQQPPHRFVSSRNFVALAVGLVLCISVILAGLYWVQQQAVNSVGDKASAPLASQPALTEWYDNALVEISRAEYEISPVGEAAVYQAPNRAHGFRTWFEDSGIQLEPRLAQNEDWSWGLQLVAYGYAGQLMPVADGKQAATGNRMEYQRGELTEWYVNRPDGLEQGFTLTERPAQAAADADTPLVLAMTLTGNQYPQLAKDGQAVDFYDGNGTHIIQYGKLHVYDAQSNEIPAHLELENCTGEAVQNGCQIQLHIEEQTAVYPITIDPIVTAPWLGETNEWYSYLGEFVGTAGDINGDGYDDMILGTSYYDAGEGGEGRVFVYYGSANGPGSSANWTATGDAEGANLGLSAGTAGDVNNDGYDDIIIGAPYWESGNGNDGGKAYVYLGSATGLSSTTPPVWSEAGEQGGAGFGHAVGTAGDVDGDGYDDIIIGVPDYSTTIDSPGRAYVYYGASNGIDTITTPWFYDYPTQYTSFAYSVSTAGDVNGDGYDDVIFGAGGDEAPVAFYGSASGLGSAPNWTGGGFTGDYQSDAAVSTAGDVNGDGYDDVIVGNSAQYENEPMMKGRAVIYHGSANGLSTTPAWVFEQDQVDHWLVNGVVVGHAGDVNDDGYDDVLIGNPIYNNGQEDEGKALLFFGSNVGVTGDDPNWDVESNIEYTFLGYYVGTAGDVNGDGYDDFLVSAPGAENGEEGEGLVYLYYGGGDSEQPTSTATMTADITPSPTPTHTPVPTVYYQEDFTGFAVGTDPANWLDTGANNSMSTNDSLFKVYDLSGNRVFGTTSIASNIHSHYVGSGSSTLSNYRYSGRMGMSSSNSGIGVTFFSDYANSDTYYRLRRTSGNDFHISPHGTSVSGDTNSGVFAVVNTWYRFVVEVEDTGTQTEIRAKVWQDGTTEPSTWQIDAYDDSAGRLTAGRFGVWSSSSGSKYWDDLTVVLLNTPTATETPTATHTPTPVNTATATATNTQTPTATNTQTPTVTPTYTPTSTSTATPTNTPTSTPTSSSTSELHIVKQGPTEASAGQPITYTLTISNPSAMTATNLIVTDTLPVGSSYISGGTLVDGEVVWSLPTLTGNSTAEVSFVVTATNTITNSEYGVSASNVPETKLTATNGAASDYFGKSLAIDGNAVVIGAWGNGTIGYSAGTAYAFTESGTGWIQQAELTSSSIEPGDYFGYSVDISGDTIIVGAFADEEYGFYSGSAYIFVWNGSSWVEQAKLIPANGATADYFGYSVALDGDTAVIGAWGENNGSLSNDGSVYVFTRNGTTWTQQQKLTANNGQEADYFGHSVAIDSNRIVVGARGANRNGAFSGTAYMYLWNGSTWVQQAELGASDNAEGDQFGTSVDVRGDEVIVGASGDDDLGHDSGSAYVFRWSGSAWQQETKLTALDGAIADYFGNAVAIDNGNIVVGALNHNASGASSGAAYVFTKNGDDWTWHTKLEASDGATSDLFGVDVAVSNNLVFIGAEGGDGIQANSGAAYLYDLSAGNWITAVGQGEPVVTQITPTTTANWQQIITANAPDMNGEYGMVYDSDRDVVVLYGGNGSGWPYSSETWEFDGSDWSQVTTAQSPNAVYGMRMVYDSNRNVTVLFGGNDANDTSIGETWEYNGTNWTQISPTASPPARMGHSMVYDPTTNLVYLFGGNNQLTYFNDVWTYNGTTWSSVTTTNASPARTLAAMALDSANNTILLFGGRDDTGTALGDTWELNLTTNTWSEVQTTAPASRMGASMVYDPIGDLILLVGGLAADGDTQLDDTWKFSAGAWVQVTPTQATPVSNLHTMVYDSNSDAILFFTDGQTWEYK